MGRLDLHLGCAPYTVRKPEFFRLSLRLKFSMSMPFSNSSGTAGTEGSNQSIFLLAQEIHSRVSSFKELFEMAFCSIRSIYVRTMFDSENLCASKSSCLKRSNSVVCFCANSHSNLACSSRSSCAFFIFARFSFISLAVLSRQLLRVQVDIVVGARCNLNKLHGSREIKPILFHFSRRRFSFS
jgi:hypothetical protein